ncbi:hypothetical protein KCP75_10325 [Salmonella enterica subsp. enterica]|nr:hypothetical protein KCP75_10325 [Salmonella enterica subsp. enterica]
MRLAADAEDNRYHADQQKSKSIAIHRHQRQRDMRNSQQLNPAAMINGSMPCPTGGRAKRQYHHRSSHSKNLLRHNIIASDFDS